MINCILKAQIGDSVDLVSYQDYKYLYTSPNHPRYQSIIYRFPISGLELFFIQNSYRLTPYILTKDFISLSSPRELKPKIFWDSKILLDPMNIKVLKIIKNVSNRRMLKD